jgi:hypothetical protein
VQLLGMRLVLWQDKQGSWRCFADMCPHRWELQSSQHEAREKFKVHSVKKSGVHYAISQCEEVWSAK